MSASESLLWDTPSPATPEEEAFSTKFQNNGKLHVRTKDGKTYSGPHTVAVSQSEGGFSISITPTSSKDTIEINISKKSLDKAGLSKAAEYFIERNKRSAKEKDPSTDPREVADWFSKKAEPLIQAAFEQHYITDKGNTARDLAGYMLTLYIQTLSRVNTSSAQAERFA
jgi:hypothetical protein